MFQLANRQGKSLPKDVMETVVPSFKTMSVELQTYYEDLYLCACYPELLYAPDQSVISQTNLPSNSLSLNILIYFTLQTF